MKVQNVSLCGSEALDGETATERKMRVKEAREGVRGGLYKGASAREGGK